MARHVQEECCSSVLSVNGNRWGRIIGNVSNISNNNLERVSYTLDMIFYIKISLIPDRETKPNTVGYILLFYPVMSVCLKFINRPL